MIPSVEILVHVSGPSGGKDDTRYRKEAKGFLDFDPAETITVLGSDREVNRAGHQSSEVSRIGYLTTGGGATLQGHTLGKPAASEDTPYEVLPMVRTTFNQEANILQTPSGLVAKAINSSGDTSQRQAQSIAKSSVQQFKTPLNLKPSTIDLQRTSVKEIPYIQVEQTPALQRPRTAPGAATPLQTVRPLRRTQSDSWKTPPSTIPDSQPAGPSYSSQSIHSSPCLKRVYQSDSPSPTRNFPPPPNSKRPRLQESSSPPSTESSGDFRSLALSQSSPLPALPPTSSLRVLSASEVTYAEIHPPPPAISNEHFTTHLTNKLRILVDCLPLSKGFAPFLVRETHEIPKLDRGYWLIPLHAWKASDAKNLWQFLETFVGGGDAGWNTRCWWGLIERDHDKQSGSDSDQALWNGEMIPEGMMEVIKVFCWGEVVREIWLMLYIGSKRAIKGLGSRWIGPNKEGTEQVTVLLMK